MRILLADNEPRVRSAVRLLLEQQPEIGLIDEVTNNRDMLEYVKNYHPDVLILDWNLTGLDPGKNFTLLHSLYPNMATIVLNTEPQTQQFALAVGANEFVSKNDPPERLLAAIKNLIKAQ
jgi:DNA-binding NarL/FixJ family response regulator